MEQGDDARPLRRHVIFPVARRESDWSLSDALPPEAAVLPILHESNGSARRFRRIPQWRRAVPTSVRLYPGGGLSRLPLVTHIRRVVEAGASWEHPIVHSDTQRRLCLIARISIIRGDAADDPEWPAMRCTRHFIFQSQTTAGPRNNLG